MATSTQTTTRRPYWHLPSAERGHVQASWLDTKHSFSFGEYYNPEARGFSVLRVINEDIVEPETGFGMHSHQDMEIVTYVLSGQLQHTDSLGNSAIIEPGTIQRMRAGSGISHSEKNPSVDTPVHLLQIWLFPDENGLEPGYEEKSVSGLSVKNDWQRIIRPESETAQDESLTIRQDAHLWVLTLDEAKTLSLPGQAERSGWIQVVSGSVQVTGSVFETPLTLNAGDGLGLTQHGDASLTLQGSDAHLIFFDLPAFA